MIWFTPRPCRTSPALRRLWKICGIGLTYSIQNGIILLVFAFLVSPMGLPMLAVWVLGKLQGVNAAMKGFIRS